jgi:hypothetical protein
MKACAPATGKGWEPNKSSPLKYLPKGCGFHTKPDIIKKDTIDTK